MGGAPETDQTILAFLTLKGKIASVNSQLAHEIPKSDGAVILSTWSLHGMLFMP
jgi:hypothetical protein